MNKELLEALDVLEKEKEISKETLFEAIENSLLTACKNHFGKADNIKVEINRETCDFLCYAQKEVVATSEEVEDDLLQISLEEALKHSKKARVGEILNVEKHPLDELVSLALAGKLPDGKTNIAVLKAKLLLENG